MDKLNHTGNCNTGHWNTGDCNTGHWNTGDWNTGDRNTGDWNTGSQNTGEWNTGHCNTGNCNTGFFNTNEPYVRMFNKMTDRKLSEVVLPYFCYFNLTEWIEESDMTDKEKDAYPSYVTTGGYLKTYDYKQAFRNSYYKASKEDREKIKKLPNFDADIFFEISGIRVDEEEMTELTLEQIAERFNVDVKNLKIKK